MKFISMTATRVPEKSDTIYGCDENGYLWKGEEHLVLKNHYDCKTERNGYNSTLSYFSYDRYFVWKRLPMPDAQNIDTYEQDEKRFLIKEGLVPEAGKFFEPYKAMITDVKVR